MGIELSADQRRAVETDSRAVVVVAAAGSGKTEVVAQRLERRLGAGGPDGPRALALTYTAKAADELRDRLRLRLGDLARRADTETTHGFAFDLLRRYGTRLGLPSDPEVLRRDEDRAELLSEWLAAAGQDPPEDMKGALQTLDLARARCEDAPFLTDLRAALMSRGAVDYPAMLDHAAELLEMAWLRRQISTVYSEVIVDEAQNLTRAQYALLTRIVGEPSTHDLTAILVGDERQSLVGFAGADSGLIQEFERQYSAERITLSTNFRSAERIVAAGHRVADALGVSSAASGQTYPAPGSIDYHELSDEAEEGRFLALWVEAHLNDGIEGDALAPGETRTVRPHDIAVLARAAATLRWTKAQLELRQIPVAMSVSPEDWVRSPAARLTTEFIGLRAAPDHRSVRRAIATLCDAEPGWSDLATVIGDADEVSIREMKGLCDVEEVSNLLPYLESVEIDDDDWQDDIHQFRQAWGGFVDRYGFADRTFANFRLHIARWQRGDNLSDGVRLLTVHKAQGHEYKAVALAACNEGQLPDFRSLSDEDRKAELRIFYVAVTRPSRVLLLTRSRSRQTRYGLRATEPSSFLKHVLAR